MCIVDNDISEKTALQTTAIGDVWGIGRRWSAHLLQQRIKTAFDLRLINAAIIRQQYNITLANTTRELQGHTCIQLEDIVKVKKNILSSKSFGQPLPAYQVIAEALSNYTLRACEKLRAQHSLTTEITVFLKTNRFNKEHYYSRTYTIALPSPSNDTRIIIHYAKKALLEIYKPGLLYCKTGVLLSDLIGDTAPLQLDLFQQTITVSPVAVMIDHINQRFGKNTVFLACQKTESVNRWQSKAQFKSPCYTTRWADIISAQ